MVQPAVSEVASSSGRLACALVVSACLEQTADGAEPRARSSIRYGIEWSRWRASACTATRSCRHQRRPPRRHPPPSRAASMRTAAAAPDRALLTVTTRIHLKRSRGSRRRSRSQRACYRGGDCHGVEGSRRRRRRSSRRSSSRSSSSSSIDGCSRQSPPPHACRLIRPSYSLPARRARRRRARRPWSVLGSSCSTSRARPSCSLLTRPRQQSSSSLCASTRTCAPRYCNGWATQQPCDTCPVRAATSITLPSRARSSTRPPARNKAVLSRPMPRLR